MCRNSKAQLQGVSANLWVLRVCGDGLCGIAMVTMQKCPSWVGGTKTNITQVLLCRTKEWPCWKTPVTSDLLLQEWEAMCISWKQQFWHQSLPSPTVSPVVSPWLLPWSAFPPMDDSMAVAHYGRRGLAQGGCHCRAAKL